MNKKYQQTCWNCTMNECSTEKTALALCLTLNAFWFWLSCCVFLSSFLPAPSNTIAPVRHPRSQKQKTKAPQATTIAKAATTTLATIDIDTLATKTISLATIAKTMTIVINKATTVQRPMASLGSRARRVSRPRREETRRAWRRWRGKANRKTRWGRGARSIRSRGTRRDGRWLIMPPCGSGWTRRKRRRTDS